MFSLDRPRVLITIILIVGIGYGGWVFYKNSRSQIPDWQVDKTQERGFPSHRVNLWTKPYPPMTGDVTFVIEFDFVNLMNNEVGRVQLKLFESRNDKIPVTTSPAEFAESGNYRDRYYGSMEVPSSGNWILRVEYTFEQKENYSNFEIKVENP